MEWSRPSRADLREERGPPNASLRGLVSPPEGINMASPRPSQARSAGVPARHLHLAGTVSDLNDAFEIARAEVNDALGVGDLALLVGRIHYRGKGSGVESESPTGWMLKFRDRKVLCFRAFREPEQALKALGLPE